MPLPTSPLRVYSEPNLVGSLEACQLDSPSHFPGGKQTAYFGLGFPNVWTAVTFWIGAESVRFSHRSTTLSITIRTTVIKIFILVNRMVACIDETGVNPLSNKRVFLSSPFLALVS
jgi:hypothetical protein